MQWVWLEYVANSVSLIEENIKMKKRPNPNLCYLLVEPANLINSLGQLEFWLKYRGHLLLPIRKDEVYQHKRCHSWRIPVGILTDLNSVPFLEKASYIRKEHYSNFCTFEIASLLNVPGHYLRKYGIFFSKTLKWKSTRR